MTLYNGIKWTIRKWNRFVQPRMMPAKDKGRKAVAYGLAGAIFGAPFVFGNTKNTTADVHLQIQLPDGYTNVGQFTAVAEDTLTHQEYSATVDADNGIAHFHKINTPVIDNKPEIPVGYDMLPNFPNPYNPSTNLRFEVPKSGAVNIDIYNSNGRLVKHLVNQEVGSGAYQVGWDGTNEQGQGVAAGVYLARMIADNYVETLKIAKVDGGAPGSASGLARIGEATRKIGKAADEPGVIYKFKIAGENIEPTSLVQRVTENKSITVPVQGKITGNLGSVSFNEADSAQVDLSQKISAAFGVNSYSVDNPNGDLIVDVNGNYLKVKGKDGDVNGSFLSDLIIRDNHGSEKRIQVPTNINPMTDIPIRTFDVQYLKQRMAGTVGGIPGSVIIDGKIYNTDANGLLNVQVSPRDSVEVKVSTKKDNNPDSFASLFWIPVKADYSKMLNIPVVSYNKMSYNTPIPISPETMKSFAAEGVFNPQNGADYSGLKGFDWTRKYKEWVDAGQLEKQWSMLFKTYTPEQQQQVSQNIVQLQHPSFVNSAYVPEIEIATTQDTLPYYKDGQGRIFPARGTFWIAPRKLAPQMGFAGYDYDNDGIMDAGEIYITYLDNLHAQKVEYRSKFIIGPINQDSMKDKTLFHQSNPANDETPHDTRLINITQLMHPEPFAIREIGGELYLGYKPKTDINRILSIP